jgi:putative aldouronate transport system substrate-binding protein
MKRLRNMMIVLIILAVSVGFAFATSRPESTGMADTSKFVEVTHHMMGNAPTNGMDKIVEAEWNKILEDQVNAHMVLRWIEWADWYTKYNLLLASGEPIDMIHSSSTWLDMWANAQRGAFLTLDDLIPVYAPLTWEEIPAEDWDQARWDGKIVAFPENTYSQYVNHGLYYRGDWAAEFGITDHIGSFEEMAVYFQGIIDNKEGVVPWDAQGAHPGLLGGWFESKTDVVALAVPLRINIFRGADWEDPFTVTSIVFDPLFDEYAKTMKDWYDRGFWRKDVMNYTGDTREQLRAGRSGSDQHHSNTWRYLRFEMDDLFPGSDLQMFAWADTGGNLVAEPITHGATSIGRNSDAAERSVMIYEILRQNEDVYRLLNYGMEGVQYEIVDGVRVRPDGYDSATDDFYSDYWGGRVDKFEIPAPNEWLGIWDIWAEYDKIIRKPYPFSKFVLDKTPIEAELAALSDVIEQKLVPINWGVVDNPAAAVQELRDALKQAGYDKVLQELQRQVTIYKNSL